MKSIYVSMKPCILVASVSMMLLNPTLAYFSHSVRGNALNANVLNYSRNTYELWAKKRLVCYDLSDDFSDDPSFDGSSFDGSSGSGSSGSSSGRNKKKTKSSLYSPKSEAQHSYVSLLRDSKIPLVIALGPAGCGKTLFACMQAVTELNNGNVHKIVMTRPLVSVEEEEIGFLPGNMVSKMDPWTRPMIDIFREFYSMTEIQTMIRNGVIEIAPLAYMRGRTFHRTFVIADEMQNSSPNQMLMLTTRLGIDSKMVITGDLQQSDRDRSSMNGLVDFVHRYRTMDFEEKQEKEKEKEKEREKEKEKEREREKEKEKEKEREKEKEKEREKDLIQIVEMSLMDVFRSNLVSRVLHMYQSSPNTESEHSSGTTESYELVSPRKPNDDVISMSFRVQSDKGLKRDM